MTLLSAIITLLLVMDPLGNVPSFLAVLRDVPNERRRPIILRESLNHPVPDRHQDDLSPGQ